MSGYLSRLVQHTRGESAIVRPVMPAVTAPDPGAAAWDAQTLGEAELGSLGDPIEVNTLARAGSHAAEIVFVFALAAAAFGRRDDRVGTQLHAALRTEWTSLASVLPRSVLDRYEQIVAVRRSSVERFDDLVNAAAASLWPGPSPISPRASSSPSSTPASAPAAAGWRWRWPTVPAS